MTTSEVVLVCPPGAEQGAISHGTVAYEPWHDHRLNAWLVRVPSWEIAHFFCRNGGFFAAPADFQDEQPR